MIKYLVFIVALCGLSLGYIDPGTGWVLGNGLWPMVWAGLAGVVGTAWYWVKQHKLLGYLAGMLLVCVGLFFLWQGGAPVSNKRVIVLGIDGLNPEFVEPLMAAGNCRICANSIISA